MGVRRKGAFVVWKVTLPERLATEVEMSIVDPIRHKPIYGIRSQLITDLLTAHINKLKEEI